MSLLLSLTLALTMPAAESRPNIVLIHADDLGINDLGCYGRRDHRTPHLDRLATQGLRFTSAYCAQPICSPSRAALLTGKTPARLNLTTYLPGRPDTRSQKVLHPAMLQHLPREETTLAEMFRDAGYATACVGKWHLGGKGFLPPDQGFDVYLPGKGNTTPSDTEGGKGESELTRQAIGFVEKNRERPFLLYLSHDTPHIPLAARKDLVASNKDAFHPLYAAVIETMDDAVGRLLTRLDELGLASRTVVVFTSDNGGLHVPELRDDPPTHNTPYRAGKGFLYEGGLRVPLIIRWPGRIKPDVSDVPVINTDLLPTLAELAGMVAPRKIDGVSYAGLLLGTGKPADRPLFWHFPHYTNQGGRPGGAMRQGNWKLVTYYDGLQDELYHLGRDLGEQQNVAAREPKLTDQMKAKLAAWKKEVGARENLPNPDYDERLYRLLYVETDVTRLLPARTAAEMTPRLADWRRTMDRAATGR